jgi:hypothetical protein
VADAVEALPPGPAAGTGDAQAQHDAVLLVPAAPMDEDLFTRGGVLRQPLRQRRAFVWAFALAADEGGR